MSEQKTLTAGDFCQEIIYVAECPYCENMIETSEDPDYESYIYCDGCEETIDIVN